MSDNPFTKTNSERNAIRKLAVRIRNLERRITGGGQRLVYGQLNTDASAADAGSGDWSASTDGGGNFTITFDPAFAGPPTVLATANEQSDAAPVVVVVTAIAADSVDLATYLLNGGVALSDDMAFNFIAVGV